ncbi:MAG: nitrous oxide reductase family maturation protein NosD [Promethearchaeota archaeon]
MNSWPSDRIRIHEINSSIEENLNSAVKHAPIFIDGNDALATFIEDEGLSGDGTKSSPYIIENLFIEASTAHGIEIRSTDAYLIIQNCKVEGMDGIHLFNATNVNVSNNTANNNNLGIWLGLSSKNTLSGNNVSNNSIYGIYLSTSSNNTLSKNTAYNNSLGIFLGLSSNNTLSRNTANNNSRGIYLYYSSNNNTLSRNTANYNEYGIQLSSSNNYNTLIKNTVNKNDFGIWLSSSSNNTLSGNTASYNKYGIYLEHSSNKNTIYFNDIYGNTNGQAFEKDDCIDNHWDNGTTGNYWGDDYISNYPSAANDGTIWNIPYEISGNGSGIDHFPLVNSITTGYTIDDSTDTTTIHTTDDTPGFSFMIAIFFSLFLLIRRKNK